MNYLLEIAPDENRSAAGVQKENIAKSDKIETKEYRVEPTPYQQFIQEVLVYCLKHDYTKNGSDLFQAQGEKKEMIRVATIKDLVRHCFKESYLRNSNLEDKLHQVEHFLVHIDCSELPEIKRTAKMMSSDPRWLKFADHLANDANLARFIEKEREQARNHRERNFWPRVSIQSTYGEFLFFKKFKGVITPDERVRELFKYWKDQQ